MIASGTFAARGTSLKFAKSPDKGTECVVVMMRLLDGPDKDATIDWVGWLTDKTTARTQEALALMGYDFHDDASVTKNTVQVVIEHEEYERANGEKGLRPRVAWVNNPSGAGRFDTMGAVEVAGVKERMKAAALAAKNKAGAPVSDADEPRF
jgi:hypothetical protein